MLPPQFPQHLGKHYELLCILFQFPSVDTFLLWLPHTPLIVISSVKLSMAPALGWISAWPVCVTAVLQLLCVTCLLTFVPSMALFCYSCFLWCQTPCVLLLHLISLFLGLCTSTHLVQHNTWSLLISFIFLMLLALYYLSYHINIDSIYELFFQSSILSFITTVICFYSGLVNPFFSIYILLSCELAKLKWYFL